VQAVIVRGFSRNASATWASVFYSAGIGGGQAIGVGRINYGQLQNALGDPLGLTGLGLGLASNTRVRFLSQPQPRSRRLPALGPALLPPP